MKKYGTLITAVAFAFILTGCKDELYSRLDEREANQMIAVLADAGVVASKVSNAKDDNDAAGWEISVDGGDVRAALDALHAQGLPHPHFASLGEMFQQQGLVATPAEERVRYIYGVSQELSRTLQDVDGVIVARVQVVIPENDPLSDKIKPSSAAVYIKYRAGADLHMMAPMVKDLVAHSIEGLSYDNVSLFLQGAPVVPHVSRGAVADALSLDGPLGWIVLLLVLLTVGVGMLIGVRRGLFGKAFASARSESRTSGE